jgi:hypothetical protein
MEERSSHTPWVAIILLCLLPCIYAGSYLALVEAQPLSFVSGPGPWRKRAVYRVGGAVAAKVYWPINKLDRKVRPDYWKHDVQIYVDTE